MHAKKIRVSFLILIVSLFVSSLSFAAPLTSNPVTMPKASSTGAFGTNYVPEGKSPTTGLAWSGVYQPLVVQISNAHQARPHWNLSEADIVYESILWGPGHTRYTAIYSDNHPDFVGAIRSARWHHCELRQEWDAPFVYYGGQEDAGSSIKEFFNANKVDKKFLFNGIVTGSYSSGYSRDSSRVSPHNAVADLQKMVADAWPKNDDGSAYAPKQHAFAFSDTPSRGADTAVEIYICYDEKDYYPHYTFNAAERVYERWYCGEEQYDGKSGKRIVASNVIVQFCKTEYVNKQASRPMITTTRGGVMDAYIDGRHIRGTWERNTVNDRTIFLDANGNEITLLPGKTFIQMIPESMDYKYVTADGQEKIIDIGTEVVEADIDMTEDISALDQMQE